jgi:hypothetical protein
MNDKPKHTEGDWQVSKESSTIITNEHGLIIGSASGCPDSGYFPSNETAVANAVLMAAAPRLLEALEALTSNPHVNLGDLVYQVRDREGLGWDGPQVTKWSNAVQQASAAIAKAKS